MTVGWHAYRAQIKLHWLQRLPCWDMIGSLGMVACTCTLTLNIAFGTDQMLVVRWCSQWIVGIGRVLSLIFVNTSWVCWRSLMARCLVDLWGGRLLIVRMSHRQVILLRWAFQFWIWSYQRIFWLFLFCLDSWIRDLISPIPLVSHATLVV